MALDAVVFPINESISMIGKLNDLYSNPVPYVCTVKMPILCVITFKFQGCLGLVEFAYSPKVRFGTARSSEGTVNPAGKSSLDSRIPATFPDLSIFSKFSLDDELEYYIVPAGILGKQESWHYYGNIRV